MCQRYCCWLLVYCTFSPKVHRFKRLGVGYLHYALARHRSVFFRLLAKLLLVILHIKPTHNLTNFIALFKCDPDICG